MANHYYDGTGVLVLTKVTPVIRALFADFDIEEINEQGEAVIAIDAEHTDPSWEKIKERLATLVAQLKLELPTDTDDSIDQLLYALASHFGQDDDYELHNFIMHNPYCDPVQFSDLFDLAQAFNDGHDLKAVRFEGAYTCDRHMLGEFSGDGEYLGRHYRFTATTSAVYNLAPEVDEALSHGDIDAAAALLYGEFNRYLEWTDPRQREQLRQLLVGHFSKN